MDRIVKVEAASTSDALKVHQLFLQCGEIHAFHPYKSNTPGDFHCFIHFVQKTGAEHALSLNPAGFRVYSIAMNPHLVNQYRAVVLSPPSTSPLVSLVSASDEPTRDPTSHQNNHCESAGTPPSVESSSQALKSTATLKPRNDQQNFLANAIPSSGCSESMLLPSLATTTFPLTPSPPPSSLPVSQTDPCSAVSPASPVSPLLVVPNLGGPFFSLERRIVMFLCGESITYDLEALETDPQAIIALLKATASERGSWMIVAGQYRRKGNPSAALTVMTTMIEVMTAHGVLEDDLNPAFLMLSGCETDLWKRTMGQQPGESLEHYNRSQRWLQKVYGTQRPLPQPTAVPEVQVSDDSHSGPDAEVNPKATNTVPVRAEVEASTPDDRQSNTASVPNTTEYPTETSLTLMPAPTHTPATASSISASRLPMLECEVKSLRKRQESQAVTIDNMQSLKRKVEADYSSERSLRRKLERHLDDLNKELNLARRSETHALEQLKREVETRRRAEENLSIERDRRREVEKLSEQRMVKPLYEDLAHMFQRAAQGDELAFTSYSAGTAHSSTPFSYGA